MMFGKRLGVILTTLMMLLALPALAGPKTLIKYKGGKASAGLAKSWKSLGAGKYQFNLDTAAKVKGKPLTPAMVKSSVEAKLGKKGVKVAAKGVNAVTVTYSGAEAKFLKKISKVRIKSKKSVSLALETSVSDGGIRAKTAERGPKDMEVKGRVMAVQGDAVKILVLGAGKSGMAAQAKAGQNLTVKGRGGFTPKTGDYIFFRPTATGVSWTGSNFTDK